MNQNTICPNEQPKPLRNKCWILGVVVLALLFSSCDRGSRYRHNNMQTHQTDEVTTSSTPESDEAPSWLYGEWQCQSNYGLMGIKIIPDQIIEVMPDGEVSTSRWHMQGTTLMTDGTSGTYYDLDMANQRIAFGGGYYFYKVR